MKRYPLNMGRRSITIALCLHLASACDEQRASYGSAASPQYLEAVERLDRVRSETLDSPYESEEYEAVLAAFEAVPEGSSERELAESWIAWLEGKREDAVAHRRRLAREVMAPADSYKEFLDQRAEAARAADADRKAESATAAGSTGAARPRPAVEVEVDEFGRDRDYWYHRSREIADRLDELENELSDQREYTERVCFRFAMDECAQAKVRLAELEQQRDKIVVRKQRLKDEARRSGVPPGWLRRAPSADESPEPGTGRVRRLGTSDEVDNNGRGKRYWQDRKRGLLDRIDGLEDEVARAREEAHERCAEPGSGPPRGDGSAEDGTVGRARSVDLSEVTHDPAKIDTTDPAQQACTRARTSYEKLKRELQKNRDELAGLKDEARRAGALPGWIR